MDPEIQLAIDRLLVARRMRGFPHTECFEPAATDVEVGRLQQAVGSIPPDLLSLWSFGNGSRGPHDHRAMFGVYQLASTASALRLFSDPTDTSTHSAWVDHYEFSHNLVAIGRLIPVFDADHYFLCLRMDDLANTRLILIGDDPVDSPDEETVDTGMTVVQFIDFCTELHANGLMQRVGTTISIPERPRQLRPGMDARLLGYPSWEP